jgi:hypothetical protein
MKREIEENGEGGEVVGDTTFKGRRDRNSMHSRFLLANEDRPASRKETSLEDSSHFVFFSFLRVTFSLD